MKEYLFKVESEEGKIRLDVAVMNFLKQQGNAISRTAVQKLIQDSKITVNGIESLKPHHKVKSQDEIKIILEEVLPEGIEPENIPLEIVYEDDDLAVINKQAGLVTHPAPGNYKHTLVNAILYHIKKLSDINPQRPGIVHRLDKETSGLIVIAKNNAAHLNLAAQFAKHSIKRIYIALVRGKVEFDENIIEMPIGRHPRKRKNMAVGFSKNTKYAKTFYRTLQRFDSFSLLELEPFTGRTHQLRVHLDFLGHPILGDTKYGQNNKFERLALHAKSIGFIHPRTAEFMEFSSDLPGVFTVFLNTFAPKPKKRVSVRLAK